MMTSERASERGRIPLLDKREERQAGERASRQAGTAGEAGQAKVWQSGLTGGLGIGSSVLT